MVVNDILKIKEKSFDFIHVRNSDKDFRQAHQKNIIYNMFWSISPLHVEMEQQRDTISSVPKSVHFIQIGWLFFLYEQEILGYDNVGIVLLVSLALFQ